MQGLTLLKLCKNYYSGFKVEKNARQHGGMERSLGGADPAAEEKDDGNSHNDLTDNGQREKGMTLSVIQ